MCLKWTEYSQEEGKVKDKVSRTYGTQVLGSSMKLR